MMKETLTILIFLCAWTYDLNAQVKDLRKANPFVDNLSMRQILLEDAESNYLSDDFNRYSIADSTVVEVFVKNEKVATFTKDILPHLEFRDFSSMKRNILVDEKGKRILRIMFFTD